MVKPIQVRTHWAVVETTAHGAGWKGLWAVYADVMTAGQAQGTERVRALVSGTTAVFATHDEANAQALLDADRSAAVVSGTYRN